MLQKKTGNLIAIKGVSDKNDLMIINKSGITIRLSIDNLRVMGRATQGVKLINLREGDSIAAVAVVENPDSCALLDSQTGRAGIIKTLLQRNSDSHPAAAIRF